MSGTHKDRRRHRRKVAGSARGLQEHRKRNKRRNRPPENPHKEEMMVKDRMSENEDFYIETA